MERTMQSLLRPRACLFTLSLRLLRFCEYLFAGAAIALLSLYVTVLSTAMPWIYRYEPRLDVMAVNLSSLITFIMPPVLLAILAGTAFLLREYLLAGRPPFLEYVRFIASAWRRRTRFRTSCDSIFGVALLLSVLFFGVVIIMSLWYSYLAVFVFELPVAGHIGDFFTVTPLFATIFAAFLLRRSLLFGKPPGWEYAVFVISAFVTMIALCQWFQGDWAHTYFNAFGIHDWWYSACQVRDGYRLRYSLLFFVMDNFIPLVTCIPLIAVTLLHWGFARNNKETE